MHCRLNNLIFLVTSVALTQLAFAGSAGDEGNLIQRLPAPDAYVAPDEGPWLIRGQATGRMVSFDSAGTFVDVPAPPACDSGWLEDGACCNCGYGSWWENSAVLLAADSWRTRADDDYPGNFGFRTGINAGIGWWDSPVRVQLGGSYAGYDLSGRDGDIFGADFAHSAAAEQQLFFTGGVYKRSNVCAGDRLAWGAVLDVMYDNRFGQYGQEIFLSQMRGVIGYALDEANEIGVWGAFRSNCDHLPNTFQGNVQVRGLDQFNMFWHHNWAFGGDTWVYAGGGEDPLEWIVGLSGTAPLSPSIALFGGMTWGIPSAPEGDTGFGINQNYSEQYYNVSFGIVWYPGMKAANSSVSGYSGMPLLPVADNGSFMVKAPVGNL
jgi:hypothetical protein